MVELLEHQVKAILDTKGYNRVAYYLDMGLGKTFVGSEKMKALNSNLNLLVCQKSKIQDWKEHFEKYYGEYNVIVWKNQDSLPNIDCKSVILINYELVWRRPILAKLSDFTLICDESSYIKNPTSKRTKFITRHLKPKNIILLSGTPCGGKYEELYTQCRLLNWDISKKQYWNDFIKYINMDIGGFKIPKVTGYKNVDRLKRKLREHGAIFMKTEEVVTLPEQLEYDVIIKNTKQYKDFNRDDLITLEDGVELVGDTTLSKMLYLRQLASSYNKNKVVKLKELMESTEDRLVIFYNFNKEKEIIEDICNKLDKPISYINGNNKDVVNFKSKINGVCLCQYQAASMGHNLQESNKIIYFSLPLSSELFEQSKKRTHRIGQKRTCMYWYLITKNSIDEKIYSALKERRDYTNKLFEGGH